MTSRPLIVDTHVALWLTEPGTLAPDAASELVEAHRAGRPILVSPITAWEVGLLTARGRIALPMAPAAWFERLLASGLQWAPMGPDVLIAASYLPGQLHGDPADRILAATARAYGYQLMTRDRALLAYAKAGHIRAIPC